MKKAAKVFLIIGICLQFYFVYPIVLGVITIKKINRATKADELRGWGIVSLLFVSIIGGAFVLSLKDYDLQTNNKVETKIDDSAVNMLKELKEMHDNGIINDSEYQEKKKKYLEVF